MAQIALNELIDVAVPLPVYQSYTYRVPLQFKGIVRAGMRVLVPFKRRQFQIFHTFSNPLTNILNFDFTLFTPSSANLFSNIAGNIEYRALSCLKKN